ncbi:hypothetical protein COP1_036768 [Malus domestica]
MPSSSLGNLSPFQLLHNSIPVITHLKIFGCSCYPWLRPYTHTKLDPRTAKCIFLGYASNYKGYLCYDASKNKMYISRHVLFDETEFPYRSLVSKSHCTTISPPPSHSQTPIPVPNHSNALVLPECPASLSSDSISSGMPNLVLQQLSAASTTVPVTSSPDSVGNSTATHSITSPTTQPFSPAPPVVPEFQPEQLQVVLSVPPVNFHPMQTRSKSGIIKKLALLAQVHEHGGVDLTQVEPATYKSALKSPVWFNAMKDEILALHNQGTWSLVPLPRHKNLIGCKWVYKIKKNADGSIGRYKARLVAKGFNQEEGIDYGETFSPVVKPTTVRIVLALSANFGWTLRQLDVKNAFLHGILQEEVYMTQPPGFVDLKHEDYVCRLHKSLYGLKQAPRAWNERFTTFLPSLGFKSTFADSSLFVKTVDTYVVILLLYVDDIIITGSHPQAITAVIQALTHEFDMKDLGPLHYFLGIQIVQNKNGLFLSQDKYVTDLLTKSDMLLSKPCATPCLPYNRLLSNDGVCTILDQSRNYRAPANAILSRTQKSSPPTRRPITTRHVSRLEANQSAARVDIKNQS